MQIELVWIYAGAGFLAGVLLVAAISAILASNRGKEWERLRKEAQEERGRILAKAEEKQRELREKMEFLEDSLESLRIERATLLSRDERLAESLQEMRGREAELKAKLSGFENRQKELESLLEEERVKSAALTSRVEELGRVLHRSDELERKLEDARRKNLNLEKELSELTTRLEEEREQSRARLEELRESRESMQKEFKLLAGRVLEENSKRFGELSRSNVEQVLKPLQQQVQEFRRRIEKVHIEETKGMATLMHEIRHLKELNLRISEDAVKLTKALRGESKRQGIWGEMVLERVLEASGLREGEEYEREVSLHNDERKRFRPDVIVHLPDRRDIIIDAKTSLVAYERYVNAENDEDRRLYARHHLEAVKNHIDRLSDKSYAELEGVNTLDFIFMFMPIEGALMLALQEDPSLYDKAFARHIVLVSPTTLLVALRAVENTWRRERQNRNALEIARRAGALYDKFVGFAEDLERVGKQLETVQKSYDSAWKKLSEGRGNIVRQIEGLRELGARASKEIPKTLADDALEENDGDDPSFQGE